jgi:hypothetical protein
MLGMPEKGFRRSVNENNVTTNFLADWIEASLLFSERQISKNEIVDLLMEEQVCPDGGQDLAHAIATAGWTEVALRKRWGGIPATLIIDGPRIQSGAGWQSEPIRAFFVMLSILRIYPEWAKAHQDFSVQGDLFEKVVEIVCPHLLPGWVSYRAGWSPENTKNIPVIVTDLCDRLFMRGASDLQDWISPDANDGGLDIVCYRSFSDEREATPTLFLQCASGKNWRDKVQTPDSGSWQKYLNSAVQPGAGIVAPFVIEDKELRMAGLRGQIVVFDRLRLMDVVHKANVNLPAALNAEIIDWVQARAQHLPAANF